MNTLFNPMAMAGMHPAGRTKKIKVNYCFKSSCEINETLRALRWLKRSLPTFNRLFNHTQLELCVCSCLPLLNTVACTLHANRLLLAEMAQQMRNPSEDWMPIECDQSSCPSKCTLMMTFKQHAEHILPWLLRAVRQFMQQQSFLEFCLFCFPALFQ